jgi:hypothetical protein
MGVLKFDERKFREIRYGFVASKVRSSVSETNAILVIQRAIKRYLKIKRGKDNRRRRGFMSCHGVHRMCGLTIAYVMLANTKQTEFKLTVKENQEKELKDLINDPIFKGKEDHPEKMFAHTIVNRHLLSAHTIK